MVSVPTSPALRLAGPIPPRYLKTQALRVSSSVEPGPMDRPAPSAVRSLAVIGGLFLCLAPEAAAQRSTAPTRADTLRGSDGPARAWWNVTYYDLNVRVQPSDSSLSGWNAITYRVVSEGHEVQIDLQSPMSLDSLLLSGHPLELRQDGNAWFATVPGRQAVGSVHTLTAYFHGRPEVAVRPPWDGGYQWEIDGSGAPCPPI